jgi:hypothetical protein
VVFTQGHNLNAGVSGFMFLPLPVGGSIAVATVCPSSLYFTLLSLRFQYIFFFNLSYERKVKECAPNPVPLEYRLRVAMTAAPPFAISFFWFAWTSYSSISIWAPMMSGALLGWSICLKFVRYYDLHTDHRLTVSLKLSQFNYIIDSYLSVAASALAANTVVRSLFGAAFPVSGCNDVSFTPQLILCRLAFCHSDVR